MTNTLTRSLREAPATVPALAALALFVVWAGNQAGYPVTHWGPGGLIMVAFLGVALAVVGPRMSEIPRAVQIALGCLAAYTALSFLSILWASVPGDAWEGANRTLLYLLVFGLFACWPQRGPSAALLLGAWTLAMIALAAFVALHVNSAADSPRRLEALLPGARLVYPAGYANADAAQWLMAFWPALLLARSARLPWAVRGALAGGAVLLAGVALLSQSRGALYATPVMLVLVFALAPGRARTFTLLVPVAAGIGAAAPAVLRVGDSLNGSSVTQATVHNATAAIFASAVGVGLIVCVGAAIETRRAPSPATARRIHRGVSAAAVATLVAIVVGGWVAAGDPFARVHHAWETFTSERGYGANASGDRLLSGLGSNRYDFYRVALDEFVAHPLIGIGADNFQQQYLLHGRSLETPRYPHSVELRTLSQTGLVGSLLALVGLGAALLAAAGACRRSPSATDPLRPAVAVAALAGFAYWLVHGSFDWFWEFAGLGAPAFAMLGLSCALSARRREAPARAAPRPARTGRERSGLSRLAPTRSGRLLAGLTAAVFMIAASASLAAPWLSQLEVQRAAEIWPTAPRKAYASLNQAARLNPLSDEPYLVAGSIALRFGDLRLADRDFSSALARTPGDAYATLERGAIASSRGERGAALALLARAVQLNPRDQLTRSALAIARQGRRIDVQELNRSILLKAQQLS